MNTHFNPISALKGSFAPPADKSISHRAALFSAMCDEPVTICNYLDSEDTQSTLDAIQALGAAVDQHEGGELVIRGAGLRTPAEVTGGTLNVGNAGTLLRLLPGWLAGQSGGTWTLDGDESIRRRPVDRIIEPLRQMGADMSARDDRLPPLQIGGTDLRAIDYVLPVASAQVKSCVLIAGMLATGQTTVTEPELSRDHTERILARARAPFERDGRTVKVSQVDELELDRVDVPGDPSSAAFIAAAACIVPNARVVILGMALNWTRTGFFRIAQRMGAVVLGELEGEPPADTGTSDTEPVGDVDIAQAPLEGTTVESHEVPLAIDELPLVALLGCFAEGDTVVKGAQELRLKESDRIAATVEGLTGLGADIEATDDGFVVHGGTGIEGGTIDARGDHRMAMLGAVAGIASRSGVEVVGMEAAAVSYPGFEQDLRALVA
ncbi:MAG: 3-phosphoshikimate 1-carboxyvinyltransferase [Thermoleophilaceae bacterium]|jgi:3-phosphoshikimate 1-carboxyvinyltransferase|nr:3-phosphoshikimate 1-carboxyvinyltransferase [Thermoleophilaceae bacterium]